MAKRKKHLHFIGIGGTAMAPLARTLKKAGFKVTGSEPEGKLYPPMSDYLKDNKIPYYCGFNGKKMGQPDEIVIGNAYMSEQNPEIVSARANRIPIYHYPHLAEKYLIKANSIVVAGTYGKTTATSMLAWLLIKAGKNPNYLIGGIPLNLKHGVRLNKSKWSVVEGDEYPSASPWDFSPKFNYYHPKYLVLTSAAWDHLDIYKTKESYIKVFRELAAEIPKDGLIVANLNGENISRVLEKAACQKIFYSLSRPKNQKDKSKTVYFIDQIEKHGQTTAFCLRKNSQTIGRYQTRLFGNFNLENWVAALALANELKLPPAEISQAVKSFKGVKRRLEIRYQKAITIIDDFAHSPSKAKASLQAIKSQFPQSRILAVFEPNRGNRNIKTIKSFDGVFKCADIVFIPQLSKYTPKKGVKELSGEELVRYLQKTRQKVIYQKETEKLADLIFKNIAKGDIVAFLGSRDFDSPIRSLTEKLER